MNVLLIGATGTIGTAVARALEARGHAVLRVGRGSGALRVDLADPDGIRALYRAAGPIDAVVCTAGIARFGSVSELSDDDLDLSVRNKLLGQMNLVRLGLRTVRDGGSFTLTSGDLSSEPAPGATAVVATGAGVEAFVRAAALDLEGRFRVNCVSPGVVAESLAARGQDPSAGTPADELARHYVRAVEGSDTGRVFDGRRPAGSA